MAAKRAEKQQLMQSLQEVRQHAVCGLVQAQYVTCSPRRLQRLICACSTDISHQLVVNQLVKFGSAPQQQHSNKPQVVATRVWPAC